MNTKFNKILFEDNLTIVKHLRDSRLFKNLPEEFLKEFVNVAECVDYPEKSEILIEGQTNDTIYFLLSGEVSVHLCGEKIINLKRRGDVFGEMSIIGNRPCSATIVSDTAVTLLTIRMNEIKNDKIASTNAIPNILFRIFSAVLTDKLVLTTNKAQSFEETNRELQAKKYQLQETLKSSQNEIAKRKKSQEDLRQYQIHLQELVEERTAVLEKTNQELQAEVLIRQQAEKQSLESEERFRNLVEISSDWIWEFDQYGHYTYASPAIKILLGYEPEEIIELSPSDFVHKENKQMTQDQYERLLQDKLPFKNLEVLFLHKDGQSINLESSGIPIYNENDGFIGFRGIDRDITERKWVEEKLIQAKQKAEAANQAKSEFLANMSHEIRTPMHGILSFSKFGTDKIEKSTPDKLLHYFKQINQSGQRLLILLDDILDLSKMQVGKMTYEMGYSNIQEIVNQALVELKPAASEKKIDIILRQSMISTRIKCDAYRIGQVVRNLLSNAIKFTSSGRRISVFFDSSILKLGKPSEDKKKEPAISVSIKDEGIGIPEKEIEYVFEKFTQSSKTKTGAGGTGLGLAICKEIIEYHSGKIFVKNNDQTGVTFSFILPRRV
jgi:PAS domain S-box-containing protein